VKHGLRTTIIAGLMPTLATGLAGMPGVDLDHMDTVCLGFVLDKGVQLGKAPTMQAAFVVTFLTVFLATPHLGGVLDVLEVFQHDGCTWEHVQNKALREDVIVVSASPKLFPAQLFEVTFRRASAFGLQLSFVGFSWTVIVLSIQKVYPIYRRFSNGMGYPRAQNPKKGAALPSPGMNAGVSRAGFDESGRANGPHGGHIGEGNQ
jgi:hypothetical protein